MSTVAAVAFEDEEAFRAPSPLFPSSFAVVALAAVAVVAVATLAVALAVALAVPDPSGENTDTTQPSQEP